MYINLISRIFGRVAPPLFQLFPALVDRVESLDLKEMVAVYTSAKQLGDRYFLLISEKDC